MKKHILRFNYFLTSALCLAVLLNYASHEYAALELDMISAKYIHEPVENEQEAMVILFIKEFEAEADRRNIPIDLSRITYKIHDEIGRDQAFVDRSLTIFGGCEKYRQHLVFLKSEINPYNISKFRETVFHELGHCALNLDHQEDEFTNGVPNILAALDNGYWNSISPEEWAMAVDNLFKLKNQ